MEPAGLRAICIPAYIRALPSDRALQRRIVGWLFAGSGSVTGRCGCPLACRPAKTFGGHRSIARVRRRVVSRSVMPHTEHGGCGAQRAPPGCDLGDTTMRAALRCNYKVRLSPVSKCAPGKRRLFSEENRINCGEGSPNNQGQFDAGRARKSFLNCGAISHRLPGRSPPDTPQRYPAGGETWMSRRDCIRTPTGRRTARPSSPSPLAGLTVCLPFLPRVPPLASPWGYYPPPLRGSKSSTPFRISTLSTPSCPHP
jgi:hypothetical protein